MSEYALGVAGTNWLARIRRAFARKDHERSGSHAVPLDIEAMSDDQLRDIGMLDGRPSPSRHQIDRRSELPWLPR